MQGLSPRGHMGITVKFDSPQEEEMFREDLQSEHFIQRRFGQGIVKFRYDTASFDWDSAIRRVLVEKGIASAEKVRSLASLSNLHEILSDDWMTLEESELNKASIAFYEVGPELEALYRRFIKEAVADRLGEPVWWQQTPTIRFHFPRQKGFDWKVRYHTDIMLGHPPQEINVWIALTRTYGSNSMRIADLEASYGILKGLDFDFEKFAEKVQYDDALAETCARVTEPLTLEYGEFIAFDPRCIHATQNNLTEHTRISLDLRVLPRTEQERMRFVYRGTGRRRMLFAPGHYYDNRLSAEI